MLNLAANVCAMTEIQTLEQIQKKQELLEAALRTTDNHLHLELV